MKFHLYESPSGTAISGPPGSVLVSNDDGTWSPSSLAVTSVNELSFLSASNGSRVFVSNQNEYYSYEQQSEITPHPTLVIQSKNGGRWFKKSKQYVIGAFTLWLSVVPNQVYGLTVGQQISSGILNPDIRLNLSANIRQIGQGCCDSFGNLWVPDVTLHAQGGQTLKYLLETVVASGSPSPGVVLTGVPVNDHNNSIVAFDKQNNLWRGSSVNSCGTFQKISQSSYRASGSPPPVTSIIPTAGDWDDVNKCCIFDYSGNLWYATSVEAVPLGSVTPQIGMVSASQLLSGGTVTPSKVWSGSNFPTTSPANQGPAGLAFAPSTGLLWTCAYVPGGGTLKAFDPSSPTGNPAPIVTISCSTFNGINSLLFDSFGNLWVIEYDGGRLYMFNQNKLTTSGTIVPDIQLNGTPANAFAIFQAGNPDTCGLLNSGNQ